MGILAHGVFTLIKSKAKVLAVVFAFAIIAGALVWNAFSGFWKINKAQPAEQQAINNNQQMAPADDAGKDSDNDGLKDWEEGLYGTDPEKSDSDGDKTPDGEEIRLNRDPLKKGPDDKMRQPTADATGMDQLMVDDANLTYNLIRNLISSGILNEINAGGQLASNNFLNNLSMPPDLDPAVILKQAAVITTKDIPIVAAGDADAVRRYFNSIYAVYAKNFANLHKGDFAILSEVAESGDFSRLAELESITSAITRSVAEISKIPVPSGYENFTMKELNYMLQSKRAIEILGRLNIDPLAAVVMLPKRIELAEEFREFHQETKAGLKAAGVAFGQGEGGHIYFQFNTP